VPFGLMFLLPLVRLRGSSWLDLLDLGAVLSFFVSYGLFDHGHLELAVWLAYPPLLYLMCRMLIRGAGSRQPTSRLQAALSTRVLVTGLIALVAGRIAVTLIPAHVMDVAVASLIGAGKILHGQSLYFASLGHPDTYGPVAYLAYVPFELIWSGVSWGYDPAARAAAITFDLITIGALVALGVRLRPGADGRRLGLLMGWLWAACPFTVLGIVKSTNDGLVAMLLVLVVLAINSPIRRGALLGLAAAAKFIPAILLPLMAAGRRDEVPRASLKVLAGFAVAAVGAVALFLPPGGIREIYDHTIGFQLTRADIFSIWALHPGLEPLKIALELGVAGLALAIAARPRAPRSTAQVSALAAALVIAVQLPAVHWFYLYIVWFMPLVLIAVLAAEPPGTLTAPPPPAGEVPAPVDQDPAGVLVGAA
jgi:Glycosyltransferase family 87